VSDRSTEQLVHDLARDVPPVRPILPLRAVLAGVVAVWAIAVALMWILGAPSDDFVRGIRWGDPAFVAILVGLVFLAVGATLAALAGAVPGRENVARTSRGAALLGIALAAGGGLWAVFGAAAPGGVSDLVGCLACIGRAGALALLPVLAASLFLARGFVRHPILGAGFAVTGTVALGGLVTHIGCRVGGALHMLLGHALAPLILGLALAIPIGLLVRHWSQRG
jgi:hypothetical protein